MHRYNPEMYKSYEILNIPVLTDEDEWKDYKSVKKDTVLHVDVRILQWVDKQLRKQYDMLAIIPLTANTLAKMVNGLCDNLLTSTYRAWGQSKPIIVRKSL